MKRLYTYPDFVHNSIKESQDINNNMEVFALNEMQKDWNTDETKSMYDITKDNIYQKFKEKFFQRIDIILTSDEDLHDASKAIGLGTNYQSKMSETLYNLKTYGDYSNIIKNDWQTKVFSQLTSFSPNSQLQAAYTEIQKLGKIKFDATLNIKNAYDLQKRAYDLDAADAKLKADISIWNNLTEPALYLILKFLNIYDTDKFYKTHTDKVFEDTGIDKNNYIADFKHITTKDKDGKQEFPFRNFHKVIKEEFFEYYRHYHFWLFANLIMKGTSTSTSSTTSTKRKSSASSVTTPTRERRIVDRAVIGQTISDL